MGSAHNRGRLLNINIVQISYILNIFWTETLGYIYLRALQTRTVLDIINVNKALIYITD